MDRIILTMIPKVEKNHIKGNVESMELKHHFKYEIWFDKELSNWRFRQIPLKIGRNNGICEVE